SGRALSLLHGLWLDWARVSWNGQDPIESGLPKEGSFMEGWRGRALCASFVAAAALGLAPAAHASVNVTQVSSLPAGAKAGNLSGLVRNDGDKALKATVSVRAMRHKTGGALVGRTTVSVAAHGSKVFLVDVKIPSSLKKGTYYLAACTPQQ